MATFEKIMSTGQNIMSDIKLATGINTLWKYMQYIKLIVMMIVSIKST